MHTIQQMIIIIIKIKVFFLIHSEHSNPIADNERTQVPGFEEAFPGEGQNPPADRAGGHRGRHRRRVPAGVQVQDGHVQVPRQRRQS